MDDDGLRRFDVFTATHDDLHSARPHLRSRVVVSAEAYPTYGQAASAAAELAACVHRAMPTAIHPRH